jgi:hypothetical protein
MHFLLASKFSTFYNLVLILKSKKAKYLNTDSFYSVDEFFMCKNDP